MSKTLEKLQHLFAEKIPDDWSDCVKFIILDDEGEAGHFIMDKDGVRVSNASAACVISAKRASFEALINGDINAMRAVMGGAIKIDGAMAVALRLAALI